MDLKTLFTNVRDMMPDEYRIIARELAPVLNADDLTVCLDEITREFEGKPILPRSTRVGGVIYFLFAYRWLYAQDVMEDKVLSEFAEWVTRRLYGKNIYTGGTMAHIVMYFLENAVENSEVVDYFLKREPSLTQNTNFLNILESSNWTMRQKESWSCWRTVY